MSELVRNWSLKLLALAIGLTLWGVVATHDRRLESTIVETTLRVVPIVVGTPAAGHRVSAVRVDPNAVAVKGPRSTIEARESVRTLPVDVAGRRSSVTESVRLAFPESVSAVGGGDVRVTVDIRAERGTALEMERLRQ